MKSCILCETKELTLLAADNQKAYFECQTCGLIALDTEHRLSKQAERLRYELHKNSPEDLYYREFLNKAVLPLKSKLKMGMCGLDYGSGPGPTISVMLAEDGYSVENYDPFFAPKEFFTEEKYDFITCTETAEHFYKPAIEFQQISQLLERNGWFVLMTEVYDDSTLFKSWWYLRDPTHVAFYQAQTLIWLAEKYHWEMLVPHKNVRLFQNRS